MKEKGAAVVLRRVVGGKARAKKLAIDDAAMMRLADKMANAYLDSSFWIDLPIIADHLAAGLRAGGWPWLPAVIMSVWKRNRSQHRPAVRASAARRSRRPSA
jgi:hypothetical protein